jgi:O-antigen/teichoic acid export membrane protein
MNRRARTVRTFNLFRPSNYSGGVAAQMATAAIRIPVELLVPIMIGRLLGPAAVGTYAIIFLISTYIGYVADFGISYLLIREIARYSAQIKSWVSSAFVVGGIVSLALLSLTCFLTVVLFGSTDLSVEIVCAALSAVILSLGTYYVSAFYASSRMQYETLAVLLQSIVYAALSLVTLINGGTLVGLFVSLLISRLVFFMASQVMYRRMVRLTPDVHVRKTREIWRESPAFLAHNLFSMVFARIDILLLGAMAGPLQVGFYEPAAGLVTRLPFIARTFTNTSLPILSGLLPPQPDRARRHSHTLSIRLLLISFPIAVWIFWSANLLIEVSYGPAFEPTATCLRILAVSIPLLFIDNALGTIATAGNRQGARVKTVLAGCIVNIALNIVLIPRAGYVGASFSSVISELVIFALILNYGRRILNGVPFTVRDWATVMAGAASMGFALGLLSYLQVPAPLKLALSFFSLIPCFMIYVWVGLIGPSGTAVKIRFPFLHPNLRIEKE